MTLHSPINQVCLQLSQHGHPEICMPVKSQQLFFFPFDFFFLSVPQKKMLPMSKPGLSILMQGLRSFEDLQAQ